MRLLALETSGALGSIALCENGDCLTETDLEGAPRRHAQTLVTQIRDLLGERGLSMTDLQGVAVSIGPGSFTGLRVGVVCAKTIAYATGCVLTAIDTLEAIAANSPAEVERVHVAADAQRGDLFVGTYHRSAEGNWIREAPPAILEGEAWFGSLRTGDVVTGPALTASSQATATSQKESPAVAWRRLPESTWMPSARTVAEIGARQIARGLVADCRTLEPFYLRRSAAEERADAGSRPQN